MARKREKVQSDLRQEPQPNSTIDLIEIGDWLGTYRERFRVAHSGDSQELLRNVRRRSDRSSERRVELA